MVERIGWKPSSYAPYKNPTLETLSLSILQHLCFWECNARISRCIRIFTCTIYVPWFFRGRKRIIPFFSGLLQNLLQRWPWKLLPWILIFLVNRIICNFVRIIENWALQLVSWSASYKQSNNLLTVSAFKRISRTERLEIELIWNWLLPLP